MWNNGKDRGFPGDKMTNMKYVRPIWRWLFSPPYITTARWRAKLKMPKEVNRWWYCGEWYAHRNEEMKAGRPYIEEFSPYKNLIPFPPYEGKFMFRPEQLDFEYPAEHPEVERELEGSTNKLPLVGAIKIDGYVGLYEITRRYRESAWYDGAPWDDGYRVDLCLVEVIPLALYEIRLRENNLEASNAS